MCVLSLILAVGIFLMPSSVYSETILGPKNLKDGWLLCYAIGKGGVDRNSSIESLEIEGIFDVFDIFGVQNTEPDLSNNLIVKKAKKNGKLFIAALGLPFKGASEEEMKQNLIRHLEAPFKKEAPWDKQKMEFDGIELDEFSEVLKESVGGNDRNIKISILRDALAWFRKDYPNKIIFAWGFDDVSDQFDRVTKEVIASYVDYYLPEIYIPESEGWKTRQRLASSLASFRNFDDKNDTHVLSKIMIGLGFYTIPDMSIDDMPDKDYKINMERQFWEIRNHNYDEKNGDDCILQGHGIAVYSPRVLKQDELRWLVKLLKHYVVEKNTNWIGGGSPLENPDLPLKNSSFENSATMDDAYFLWKYKVGNKGVMDVKKNEDANIAVPFGVNSDVKVPQPSRSRFLHNGKLIELAQVLLMVRGESSNAVWQMVRLDSQKVYSLEVFAKYKDNRSDVVGAEVLLKNADLITKDKTLTPIEVRSYKLKRQLGNNYWTQFYIVFKPTSPEVEVRLTDERASRGDEIIWDFVQLQPYYSEGSIVIGPLRDINFVMGSNEEIRVSVMAVSLDNRSLNYTVSDLPLGAIFDRDTHTLIWKPSKGQAGRYPVTFTVSDGVCVATEPVVITVRK